MPSRSRIEPRPESPWVDIDGRHRVFYVVLTAAPPLLLLTLYALPKLMGWWLGLT